ncbi:MAG: hypothetical protein MI975_02030 [Cytophagales bacterium]|nr:hypothetical protein [Cytophagales bacterium]
MKKILQTCWAILLLSPMIHAQNKPGNRLWKPAADDVYLQEVAQKITTEKAVESVALFQDQCFAVIDQKVFALRGDMLIPAKKAPVGVERLIPVKDRLWVLAGSGIFMYDGKRWQKIDNRHFVDVCLHLGALHAATKEEIFKLENGKLESIKPEGGYYSSDITMVMEDGSQLHADPVRLGPIFRIGSYSGTLHVLRPGQLIQFDGKTVNSDFIDWGQLPSRNTRDMLSLGSRLYISTDRGLVELRGASMRNFKGEHGLPVENTTCLAKGFENDLWIGTARGAVRMLEDEWQYFGADHWLPNNRVNGIAVAENKVFIATDGGIGVITYEPYTLRKKAAYYERHLDEWGHKRLGFIHTVYRKGDEWVREVSDNDGAHTATYLAAMCYKYKVTGDVTAREEAVESFKAMLFLDRINDIDGFIARSIWSTKADKDERGRHGSGGLPAKWYPTEDGNWYWKGDTSSDEVIAHFYAVSLFHDLVAQGKDKELAKEHITRMASYIMDNGWMLIDMDGKPTRWGRWNPEYLLRPYGYSDRGVNGLEALTFMQTAYSVSGDEKYMTGYKQLVDWGYLNNVLRQKNTFPPSSLAPWDDNLANEAYATILRYTEDPKLRSYYLRSIERFYEIKRMEHIPWFNFTYGAHTGNDCEIDQCVKHLRAWTLDCIEHNYRNSHRDDLYVEDGYTSYEGGLKAISPRALSVLRGSRRAINLDGGVGGRRVMEPVGFLRDYWMGRYHGFIDAPTTADPDLLTVKPRGRNFGAAPYDGPGRPEF